jgi:hypothetical protein
VSGLNGFLSTVQPNHKSSSMRTVPVFIFALLGVSACGTPIPKPTPLVPGDNGVIIVTVADGEGMEARGLTIDAGLMTITTCIFQAGAALYLGERTNLHQMSIPLLAGRWCTIEMAWNGPVLIEGLATLGGAFSATLNLEGLSIESADGFDVDGHAYILELGRPDWLNANTLGMTDGEALTIDDTHPAAPALLEALITGSTLFPDFNGDGVVDEGERENPSASGLGEASDTGEPDADDTGSMVDTSEPAR